MEDFVKELRENNQILLEIKNILKEQLELLKSSVTEDVFFEDIERKNKKG
jgi:4-hydroxyphenylpyruvate dioxygenase-like putative hemolysin